MDGLKCLDFLFESELYYIDQAVPKLSLPASALWVLALQAHATTPEI